MTKIVRQPQPNRSQSVRTPPSSTPTAVEMPAIAPYRAKALPRSSPSNIVRNEARICGMITAAATPWRPREATSTPAEAASALARLVSANAVTPSRNSFLRP